jgi:protein-disulfide isomerase
VNESSRSIKSHGSRRNVLAAALGLAAGALLPARHARADEEAAPADQVPGAAEAEARYAGIHQRIIGLGELSSPVEMFVFADLQGPRCRDFARGALPVLIERYVRTAKLRLIFHNLPVLNDQSRRAARFALAISLQSRMWQFLDVFFANQGPEGSGYVTDAFLRRIAGAVRDLDVDRAMRDIDHEHVEERLQQARGVAREFRLHRNPSFIIARPGEQLHVLDVPGPSDPAPFIAAIEPLLAAD